MWRSTWPRLVHDFTGSHADQIIGHGYEKLPGLCHRVLLFVLFNNFLGLIPGVVTPTSAPVVPLGIAACTFLYYNFHGIREQGVGGYLKHLAGPIWWISWLLFPIEVISTWPASCRSPSVSTPTCLLLTW